MAIAAMYADDADGLHYRYAYDTGRLWHEVWHDTGYLARPDSLLVCPSWPPYRYDPTSSAARWRVLGMINYLSYPAGSKVTVGPTFFLDSKTLPSPSEFIMFGDSYCIFGADVAGWQDESLNVVNPYSAHAHLRHAGRADFSFADGHAEACDKPRIKKVVLGNLPANSLIRVCERDGTVVQLNP